MFKLIANYMVAQPSRFHFSDDDRKSCFKTVTTIIRLIYKERDLGRLNLEEDAYATDSFFLKKALFLFIDSVPVETAQDILESYIVFGEYEGSGLLERIIILDGILSLYRGMNPRLIEERLHAYIGERCLPDFEKARDQSKVLGVANNIMKQGMSKNEEFSLRRKLSADPQPQTAKVLSQNEIDDLLKQLL